MRDHFPLANSLFRDDKQADVKVNLAQTDFLILDTRDPELYDQVHIEGGLLRALYLCSRLCSQLSTFRLCCCVAISARNLSL